MTFVFILCPETQPGFTSTFIRIKKKKKVARCQPDLEDSPSLSQRGYSADPVTSLLFSLFLCEVRIIQLAKDSPPQKIIMMIKPENTRESGR